MRHNRILVVDDEESLRRVTQLRLEAAGYHVNAVPDGFQALDLLAREPFDLVLTDLKMPGMTGIELLKRVREEYPDVIVILITAFGTVESAVEAVKAGAYDYIVKPVNMDGLRLVIERALQHLQLVEEVRQLRTALNQKYGFENIVGQ